MDLTPGQRRLVFVVIVIVLVGLGFYLIQGRGSGGTPAAAPSTPARTAARLGAPPGPEVLGHSQRLATKT